MNATISNGWITSKRPADVIYHLDTLQIFTGKKGHTQRLKNFGKVKAAQLINVGYKTVGDVVDLCGNDERINDLCANTTGMKRDFVLQLIEACCLQVTEGVVESEVNHIKHLSEPNPYKSRYGHCWKEEIKKKISSIKDCLCITVLVTDMMRATEKAYTGTKHKDDWLVYHDALSLMRDEECKTWMKGQFIQGDSGPTFYDKWILPMHGLNEKFKKFRDQPIGNLPEMIPLDNCLNTDLHEHIATHIMMSLSSGANRNDNRLFSLTTPKCGRSAYLRIWDPENGVGPSTKRIVQDIRKVVDAMVLIHKHKGAFVPDIAR